MRVLLRSALVLTLLLALAFGLRAAEAAPPEVKASENPVVIPFGQDTKDITLTWSLTAATVTASLTITESGSSVPPIVLLVTNPPGTGTVPFTVTYGTTYTAQLRDHFTNAPLGAPLTITTKRPDIKFDFGCAVQCITGVEVEPHGTWAQFTVTTSETAIITLEASTKQPNANGEWSNPADVVGFSGTLLPTKEWTPQFPTTGSLTPNTDYHYVVRAHDGNGNEQVKMGSFRTLTRRVAVTFAEIQMIDDSDGFGAGDCDCFFWFNAGNEEPKPYGSISNQKSIESGTTVHPNVAFTITNAPGEIRIRALGMDDDTDFGEFCPAGTGAPEHTGASNWESSGNFEECLEWAGDQTMVSLVRQGPAEEFTESFKISVSGELVFNVHGTYKVTYQ
jgi:hypothetical protein